MRTPSAENPRIPGQGQSASGKSVPKARPKGVVDGNPVNIPEPVRIDDEAGTQEGSSTSGWKWRVKPVGRHRRQIRGATRSRGDDDSKASACEEVGDPILPGKAAKDGSG